MIDLISVPMVAIEYLAAPTVILCLATGLITRILSPQPKAWSRQFVVGLMLVLIVRYLIWRSLSTLNCSDPLTTALSVGLFSAELLGLTSSSLQLFLLFQVKDRKAQADRYELDVRSGHYAPKVDIFIPTYNEPAFILRRSIIGAQSLTYPNKTVYVLDDTRRPEIRDLAAELGCQYLTRPDNRHAKAGNLNHAITHTHHESPGELIVCFDADFIPTRNFLDRTIGFFQDPRIALLQTPQSFYNPDPIARNLGLENVLTPEEEVFYRQIQPMRDAVGSVVCAGTSFVLRRSAIEAAGGFVTDSLSEDYFTAIDLAAQGHQIIYLNEKLSAGLAAESIAAHVSQRLRWCRGTLQSFFINTNPLTIPGLTWMQRLGHLEGILHWFTSFSRAYFLLMPLVYALWGIIPIQATGKELLYFFVPFYCTQLMVFAWLNGRSRSAFLSDLYSLILLVPLLVTITQTLLRPFSQGFNVTPKGTTKTRSVFHWHLAWPLIALMALNAYSLWQTVAMSLSFASQGDLRSGFSLGWVWSLYNLVMLSISLMILVDAPRPETCETFALRRAVQIMSSNQTVWGTTVTLSEQGCQIALNLDRIRTNALPDLVEIHFPENQLHLTAIPIALTQTSTQSILDLRFAPMPLTEERKLIQMLFCRPGQWQSWKSPGEIRSIALLLNTLVNPQHLLRPVRKAIIVGQV